MHWFGTEPPESQDLRVDIVDEFDGQHYTHLVTIPTRVDDPVEAITVAVIEGDITPPLAEHVDDWGVVDHEPAERKPS